MKTTFFVALFALLAVPAQAQTSDPRWEPWIGCWTLAVDDVSDPQSLDPSTRRAASANTLRDRAPQVCVTAVSGGARFETTVAGQSAIDQTIVADGARHAVSDDECSGTQRSEWSRNGIRLFSSAEITCKGDQGLRRVSGVALIAPNGDWVDIQTVAVGERETVRVKRYNRVADSPRSQRPSVATSAFTLDEVVEANAKVSSAAVEAALVESGAGFNLTAKKMVELDNAGVPDRVTDLIVALSYPDKFRVQRMPQATPAGQTTYVRDPFFYYDYYGFYGSPYFYEPFGYRGYAVYSPIYVVPGDGTGGSGGSASGRGRIVNGQGYTRIEPRVEPVDSSNSGIGRTASSGRVGSTSGSSSGGSDSGSSSSGSSGSSSSSGSSGGGSASPGGYSSGGSSGGDSGGRTAIPR